MLYFCDMTVADARAVAALEYLSPSPWTKEQIAALPENKQCRSRLCRDASGAFLGWTCFLLVLDEAELLKIAVVPAWRHQGIGQALMQDVFTSAARFEARRLFLEVRERNLAARALYRKTGFTEVGRRKGYYDHPPDDALMLEKNL
jgi:ribosomal-protein-alanine N-acetyltransferase